MYLFVVVLRRWLRSKYLEQAYRVTTRSMEEETYFGFTQSRFLVRSAYPHSIQSVDLSPLKDFLLLVMSWALLSPNRHVRHDQLSTHDRPQSVYLKGKKTRDNNFLTSSHARDEKIFVSVPNVKPSPSELAEEASVVSLRLSHRLAAQV